LTCGGGGGGGEHDIKYCMHYFKTFLDTVLFDTKTFLFYMFVSEVMIMKK
jgi:hypothetical protein